jgi:hypothetical protein
VNITAAWIVVKATDVDPMAKLALLVLACHAERPNGADPGATVAIEQLAAEMGVSYGTAWRALARAQRAGYVNPQGVEKHPNKPRTWELWSRADDQPGSRASANEVARRAPKGRAPARALKKKRDLKKEGAPAPGPAKAARAGVVEKAPPDVAPAPPPRLEPDAQALALRGVRTAQAVLRAKRDG